MRFLKALRGVPVAAAIVAAALLGGAGIVLATGSSSPLKVCVPAKEGRGIVTPKGGVCKKGYALAEVNREGSEGKGTSTYTNRMTAPEGGEYHGGTGASLLEVPEVAKLTVRACNHEDARVEVTNLSVATFRVISAFSSNPYPQFASAEGGAINDIEGPNWQPFVIVDRSNSPEQDQIATFRVESGTGPGTMISTFTAVPARIGTESETECTYSVTAVVYKG